MRTALLSILLVVFGFKSHAQLRLLPMIGLENSMVCLKYNDQRVKSAFDGVLSPQISMRMDYTFKKGHGPFIGVNTNRSAMNYSFNNPATGMTQYNTSNADYRVAISGGYSFTTKPFYFNIQPAHSAKTFSKKEMQEKEIVVIKKSCGSYKEIKTGSSSRSHCGSKYKKPSENLIKEERSVYTPPKKNADWFMQVQPSAGFAFVPGVHNAIESGMQNGTAKYTYRAGDYNTALFAGANIIFGKNRDQKFIVNLNHFTGLGNLGTQSLVVEDGGKTSTTNLRSAVSGWSVGIGLPVQLSKRKAREIKVIEEKTIYKKNCERSFKPGCSRKS